ncbi:TfoX/Sxy family protein [Actinokineospora enzanensis]|uniref:TfoX/Sxy family protein n=1 Tax=Actinokineospora enzanensis TaxID=155975 RepID=UPI000362BBD1|nr:TfoX/Sxy family protein [Actinokineospora enzanensis]
MTPDALLDGIAAGLADLGVTDGKMFGKRALLADGKAFACLRGDRLAFRLGAGTPEHAAALGHAGAELFDPSGKGRPFKDWVALPIDQSDRWAGLAHTALAHLRG